MKLRYYLRGLGIGIVVTALIMGMATKDGIPLTDAEIKAKAYELGMVESDSLKLSDVQGSTPAPKPTEALKNTEAPQITAAPENTETPQTTKAPESTAAPQSTAKPQNTAAPEQSPAATGEPATSETEGTVTIVIQSGASSYSVSKQLAEAGLVADAAAYDAYLCDNGYSRIISVGIYEIAIGTGEEQIAKIITKTR